jgi:hypothetical protein
MKAVRSPQGPESILLGDRLLTLNRAASALLRRLIPPLDFDWNARLEVGLGEVISMLPEGADLILIDDEIWDTTRFACRRVRHFLEVDGQYYGLPADSAAAREALDCAIAEGANYFVLAWPCFWWKDYYSSFFTHIAAIGDTLADNDRVFIVRFR